MPSRRLDGAPTPRKKFGTGRIPGGTRVVHSTEMDAVPDPTDALDPQVARALGQVRDACLSEPLAVRPELAQLLAGSAPVVPTVRRSARMKPMLAAKLAAVVAAALAATGGLAAASALPAPVQSAVSDVADHLGVSLPSADDPAPEVADDPGTPSTTEPADATTTTTEPTDVTGPPAPTTPTTEAPEPDGSTPANHGAEVSAVAHDDSTHGCEHGRAVSAVASGKVDDKPCPDHTSDGDEADDADDSAEPSTTAPTSAPDDEHEHSGPSSNAGGGHRGEDHGRQGRGGGDD
jgi:hypothetical protein